MDVADQADGLIEAERAEAQRRASIALEGKGATHCDDCGETIPLERSRALPSARRCVGCQGALEAELRAEKERNG